ncbi:MAG: serine/threonine-protein kinase [Deltaproteobacteria bacterium]|nr:serine/threonine-protein kinase [Deltaproteobacteria bacterium]
MRVKEPTAGERLGRYQVQRELGRGAMGRVFLAEDTVLRLPVCIKVLQPDFAFHPEADARFMREIVLARRIAHPAVCRLHDLHDVVDAGGAVRFITMEFVDGITLRELRARAGELPIARALRITRRLCEGLAAAHAVGVLHRDLKPSNIMLRASAGGFDDDDVVILDFGVAAVDGVASTLTRPGFPLGTRHFIAPEVWAGLPATPRSDLFAVGVVMFLLLTGRLPWPATQDPELIEAMQRGPAPSSSSLRAGISSAVDALVAQALAVDPAQRAFDAGRFATACGALVDVVPRPVTGLQLMRCDLPAKPTPLPVAQAASARPSELEPEPAQTRSWMPPAQTRPSPDPGSSGVSWIVSGKPVDLPARPNPALVANDAPVVAAAPLARPARRRPRVMAAVVVVVVVVAAIGLAALRLGGG